MKLTATLLLTSALAMAQTLASFTATTDNVVTGPDSIRIDVFRWSTDAERDQLLAAWNLTAPAAPAGRGGGGGRAGGRGGGRANATADPTPDPSAVDGDAAPAPAPAAGRGGRGGGRGGRGGAAAAPAIPLTPERSLAAAMAKLPIVGHLWSSEVAGYSVRYAAKFAEPDGGDRIILITDRRLGAFNDLWKPLGTDAATNYEFSLVEMHLNPKGEGEAKASQTGKITVDTTEKTLALENFSALPVILRTVRRGK